MIVFLWDACGPVCHGSGVTDDEGKALEAAEACLLNGRASTAQVEMAHIQLGIGTLTSGYRRAGYGWRASHRDGRITWARA